jgi:N-acetylmuramoyl-L-alanine amidase
MNITREAEEQRAMAQERLHNNKAESKYLWVLDPGHGGLLDDVYQTSGKRSPIWEDGSIYYEGVGNRNIAKMVGDRLEELNIDFGYTVNPSDPTDVSLGKRTNWVNKLPYKNKILVSIHSNGHSNEAAQGWEIFTSKGETSSDRIATVFYNRFMDKFPDRKFRKDMKDGDVDKEANFYIIKNTVCPAVLLENFFHTNEYECKEILMTDEGQNKIVDSIVESINFIETNGIPE